MQFASFTLIFLFLPITMLLFYLTPNRWKREVMLGISLLFLCSGGWLAAAIACKKLLRAGLIEKMPLSTCVAAVSAGIVENVPMLDLCYEEDSHAMVDLNCVMTGDGQLIEIQGTGEGRPFTLEEQQKLVQLCAGGVASLCAMQRKILEEME